MPDYVTGDRADKVQAGDKIHLEPPTLTGATPEDGWVEVDTVNVVGGTVTVTHDDDETLSLPATRLIRIWRTT